MNSALDVLEFGKYINVPGPVGVVIDVASQGIPDLELNLTAGQRLGRVAISVGEGQAIAWLTSIESAKYGTAAFATGPGSAVVFFGTYLIGNVVLSLAVDEFNNSYLFPLVGLEPDPD
jgi:hypothetical protein